MAIIMSLDGVSTKQSQASLIYNNAMDSLMGINLGLLPAVGEGPLGTFVRHPLLIALGIIAGAYAAGARFKRRGK